MSKFKTIAQVKNTVCNCPNAWATTRLIDGCDNWRILSIGRQLIQLQSAGGKRAKISPADIVEIRTV